MSGIDDSSQILIRPIDSQILCIDGNEFFYELYTLPEGENNEIEEVPTDSEILAKIDTDFLVNSEGNIDFGISLEAENDESFDYSKVIDNFELVGKMALLGGYMYIGGQKMMYTYAAGLAATALATVINKMWDSPYSDTVSNAILTIELGVLKNYGMAILFDQFTKGSGPLVEISKYTFGNETMGAILSELANKKLFHTSIDSVGMVKWFGLAIPLNLLVTFMAESYGLVQNKLFLKEISDGKLELEVDPFITKRGPFTVVKRAAKNFFSTMLADIFEIKNTYGKIFLKLSGHFFANLPIALYYNTKNPYNTAYKTGLTSSAKVFGETFTENTMKWSGFSSGTSKIWSVILGTTSYVSSKILTKSV